MRNLKNRLRFCLLTLAISHLSFADEVHTKNNALIYQGAKQLYAFCRLDIYPNTSQDECKELFTKKQGYFGQYHGNYEFVVNATPFKVDGYVHSWAYPHGGWVPKYNDNLVVLPAKSCVIFSHDQDASRLCSHKPWWGSATSAVGYYRDIDRLDYYKNLATQKLLPYLEDEQWMSAVFGENYDKNIAQSLANNFNSGSMDWFPEVVIFDPSKSSASVKGVPIKDISTGQPVELRGAYKEGTIYFSNKYINSKDPIIEGEIIFIQELAHHIDALVNPYGKHTGSEGVLAAQLIYEAAHGNPDQEPYVTPLSDEEYSKLRQYRDHFDITLDGKMIYGAELGFSYSGIAIGAAAAVASVVAIVATGGAATPAVLEADSALISGEIVVTEGIAEGTAIATEEGLAALEEAGAAATASEIAPAASELLGQTFTGAAAGTEGALSSELIESAHAALERAGYRFVGYHGTTASNAVSIVNQGIEAISGFPEGQAWRGFYFADSPEVAAGYTIDQETASLSGGQLLRVYLPTAEANAMQNIGIALDQGEAITEVVNLYGEDVWDAGDFLIRGVETTGEASTESIMGFNLAKRAVVIPSSIEVLQSGFQAGIKQLIEWEMGIAAPVGEGSLPLP
ncbi:hypothetical protein ACJJIR_07450 [Microbulbifer sp. SSSA008]|uniref:hypothetical protein n=1 Tax=Microbulbifer sp. SSSA008 TaxID=3243380 RepID=UPI00403A1DBC